MGCECRVGEEGGEEGEVDGGWNVNWWWVGSCRCGIAVVVVDSVGGGGGGGGGGALCNKAG